MGKYKYIIMSILTIILLSGVLLGCGNSKKIEKITIDSLSNVSDEQLIQDVNKYLDEHQDVVAKERILMYANQVENIYKNTNIRYKKDVGLVINEIPVAGGLILDYGDKNVLSVFTEKMEKTVVLDYDILDKLHYNVAGTEKERNDTIKKFKEKFKATYAAEPEIEVYNILMMIGALKCRQVETILVDTEIHYTFNPNFIDIIDFYTYELFTAPENRERMEKLKKGIEEIYSKLPYDPNKDIKPFIEEKVPPYLYPYNLKQRYITEESENLIRNNGANKDVRIKLYNTVNGEWYSLRNEKITNIQFDPEYDEQIYVYPKINYISCIDKKEYCATFNYRDYNDENHNAFIIPVIYYDDNTQKEEEVLIMYLDYNLHDDLDSKYLKHLDLTQMLKAEDILIKHKSGNKGYECDFDKEIFSQLMPTKYMLKSKLKKSYEIENMTNIVMENNISNNDRINVYSTFNGSWTSLISGEKFLIEADISYEQNQKGSYIGGIDFVNNDASFVNFVGFNIPGKYYSTKTIFITPVTYHNNGVDENVIIAYFNPRFFKFNDKSSVSERLKYYQIDNIEKAEDVWVKSR